MRITSPAFTEGEKIPVNYTCDGANISPPLEFTDVPKEAASLVLIMHDPDVPKPIRADGIWHHWVVFDIPPDTMVVREGTNPTGILGLNTGEKLNYEGPCPPDKLHRYFFKLYALDIVLDFKEKHTAEDIEDTMKNHILAEASLMGVYEKIRK